MAQTPEGKVKKEIKEYLDSIGAYYFMPVQMGMGAATVDILCCVKGRFVAIETKAPGKVPTVRQTLILANITNAGGLAFWCTSAKAAKGTLEAHIL